MGVTAMRMMAKCSHPNHDDAGLSFMQFWLLPLMVLGQMRDVCYTCFMASETRNAGSPPLDSNGDCPVKSEKYFRRMAAMVRHSINERLPERQTAPQQRTKSIANDIYKKLWKAERSEDSRKALAAIGEKGIEAMIKGSIASKAASVPGHRPSFMHVTATEGVLAIVELYNRIGSQRTAVMTKSLEFVRCIYGTPKTVL